MKIENEVSRNQQHIKEIEIGNIIWIVYHFMYNSKTVSRDNNQHKKWTFSNYNFRFQRFGNGNRPTKGKTY